MAYVAIAKTIARGVHGRTDIVLVLVEVGAAAFVYLTTGAMCRFTIFERLGELIAISTLAFAPIDSHTGKAIPRKTHEAETSTIACGVHRRTDIVLVREKVGAAAFVCPTTGAMCHFTIFERLSELVAITALAFAPIDSNTGKAIPSMAYVAIANTIARGVHGCTGLVDVFVQRSAATLEPVELTPIWLYVIICVPTSLHTHAEYSYHSNSHIAHRYFISSTLASPHGSLLFKPFR